MGSSNKLTYLRDSLHQSGASQEELDRLRAPIGLAIASHSAEEIAISIGAELIKAENFGEKASVIIWRSNLSAERFRQGGERT
jgi:xanthine dehydrogenase accessory factor